MDKNTKLMCGDYVLVSYKGQKTRVKVVGQHNDIISVEVEPDVISDYNIVDVFGIELTEEFLYRNSYRVYTTAHFVQYSIDNIFAIKKIDDKFKFDGIELKYVHEIQHWINLCHIDKEVEFF